MNHATKREILARIANQPIGDIFYIGRIPIERIGETDVMISGYQDMPISEFINAIRFGGFFAGMPMFEDDYFEAHDTLENRQPDLQWAYS